MDQIYMCYNGYLPVTRASIITDISYVLLVTSLLHLAQSRSVEALYVTTGIILNMFSIAHVYMWHATRLELDI